LQIQVGTRTTMIDLVINTLQATALRQSESAQTRVAQQIDVNATQVKQVFFFQVQPVMMQLRIITYHKLAETVDEAVLHSICRYIMFNNIRPCALLQSNQNTLIGSSRVSTRGRDMNNINRVCQCVVARHMHQHEIRQPGIAERSEQMTLTVHHL